MSRDRVRRPSPCDPVCVPRRVRQRVPRSPSTSPTRGADRRAPRSAGSRPARRRCRPRARLATAGIHHRGPRPAAGAFGHAAEAVGVAREVGQQLGSATIPAAGTAARPRPRSAPRPSARGGGCSDAPVRDRRPGPPRPRSAARPTLRVDARSLVLPPAARGPRLRDRRSDRAADGQLRVPRRRPRDG